MSKWYILEKICVNISINIPDYVKLRFVTTVVPHGKTYVNIESEWTV